ncbi:MAG: SPOR domain-containing protein [Prevotellaceae bacterium]|jgi:hypothetical protein|nr:SPOR domain-containing protein [Prevotellaceae bacterium]
MNNQFVSSLIEELMTEYNRVSLPCLGSFLGQYKPAYIADDGKIMPPSKKIVFHQNEIWNDEKLEKLIARREKISSGEAKEKLAFWIDEVCVMLATGEQVELPGMGRLMVADRSRLVFEQESSNLLRDSFGLEPVALSSDFTPAPPKPLYQPPLEPAEKGVKGFVVVAVIVLLAVVGAWAYFFVYRSQLSDDIVENEMNLSPVAASSQSLPMVSESKFCILLGNFDSYSDARACVRAVSGSSPSIFYLSGKKPYLVSSGVFASRAEAVDSLSVLQSRDSVFVAATVIEINQSRRLVNE